ncbi:hypothetical protein WG922_14640 [Ramlibacter sp. AN1015]|uniref:hypothetical protein n=1 Tax=Ramlibacter sp. AN1015 TaxID=3133428 RepID=UPI0030C44ADF
MKKAGPGAIAFTTITLATVLMGSAHAQAIYRCGDSYGTHPCPGAQAIQADDPRTPAQQRQADHVLRRDARLADELAAARLRQETEADRQRAKGAKRSKRAAHAPGNSTDGWDELDLDEKPESPLFVAREPAKPRGATRPANRHQARP